MRYKRKTNQNRKNIWRAFSCRKE